MTQALARRYCYWMSPLRIYGLLGFLRRLGWSLLGRLGIACHQALQRDVFVLDVRSNPSLRRLRMLPFCAEPRYQYFWYNR